MLLLLNNYRLTTNDLTREHDEDDEEETDEELAMEIAALASIQAEKRAKQNKTEPVGERDDGEDSQEEEELEEGESQLGKPQKVYANDKAAIDRLLDQIKYPAALPWEETMAVTTAEPVEVKDVNNDLERELAICKQFITVLSCLDMPKQRFASSPKEALSKKRAYLSGLLCRNSKI